MNETLPTCECPKCKPLVNLMLDRIRQLETELEQAASTMQNHRRLLLSQLAQLDKLVS